MKTTVILISVLLGTVLSSYSVNAEQSAESTSEVEVVNYNVGKLFLPYAKNDYADMQLVTIKNEYSLWKCNSKFVINYPLNNITGKTYNYFVYKNGEFHLTVNDFNKNNVYMFFTDQA